MVSKSWAKHSESRPKNCLQVLKQQKLRHEMAGAKLSYEKIKETGDGFDILDEINTGRLMAKIESVV